MPTRKGRFLPGVNAGGPAAYQDREVFCWNRAYDLGQRALALAALGRWGEVEQAIERAAAVDEGIVQGTTAALLALEAALAGQSERAQR